MADSVYGTNPPPTQLAGLLRTVLTPGQAGPAAWPTSVPGQQTPPSAPAGGGPAAPAELPAGVLPVGYEVVAQLRSRVSDQLVEQSKVGMSDADRRELGRQLASRAVAEWEVSWARTHPPLTAHQQKLLIEAVFDALFRAGRLQPLLDDADIENIMINGADRVTVDSMSAPSRRVAPVAESDEELVDLVNQLAARSGQGERALTPASPRLDLRLPDGSRLAAAAWITPRPQVVIRRHRVRRHGLDQLVQWGTLDSTLAAFLRAAVRADKNIIVAGAQEAGKTTLVRALAREIPAHERIATMETEYELWLHEDDDGPEVVAFEAREGNGERGADGASVGAVTIADIFPTALRMTLRRIIVGEVRSHEAVPMLDAMSTSPGGSLCTLHVRNPRQTIERLVGLCLRYGHGMTPALAYRMVADAIDLIVYVKVVDNTAFGGRKVRYVERVLEVTGMGEGERPALQEIFGPTQGEERAVPLLAPACIRDLERAGFDPALLRQPFGSWPQAQAVFS